jgi:ribosomal protein S18 acetylase RimI-like enzyme
MTVRLAAESDVEDLFILNELFGNRTTKEMMKKSILENDREIVCIAFIDAVAVGYCTGLVVKSMCYSERRVDIEALYVKEEYRRQGIGEALIQCLENEALSRGIAHFHLNTDGENRIAQSLYARNGFSKSGEILMEKTLSI